MSIWEDISLHIHKIVSCVLTIPFVELRPGRRRPLRRNHRRTFRGTSSNTPMREVIAPLHFAFSKNKPDKKDPAETTGALFEEHSDSDTNCIKSNIYTESSEAGEQRRVPADYKFQKNMQTDSLAGLLIFTLHTWRIAPRPLTQHVHGSLLTRVKTFSSWTAVVIFSSWALHEAASIFKKLRFARTRFCCAALNVLWADRNHKGGRRRKAERPRAGVYVRAAAWSGRLTQPQR